MVPTCGDRSGFGVVAGEPQHVALHRAVEACLPGREQQVRADDGGLRDVHTAGGDCEVLGGLARDDDLAARHTGAAADVATSTGLGLLTLGFGALALAVGAATGRRAVAIGTAAGLAVLTYIGDAVAPLVEWGGVLEVVSPFAWYLGADPLATGWDLGGLAALAVVPVVAAVVALVAFDGRDLGV